MSHEFDQNDVAVLGDALSERGWQRGNQNEGSPWNWVFSRGGIAGAAINWFSNRGHLAFSHHPVVYLSYETNKTRSRIGYSGSGIEPALTIPAILAAADRVVELVDQIDASALPVDPKVPVGMHKPLDLSPSGEKAYKALLEFFKEEDLTHTGGATIFWNPKEWMERREQGLTSAVLVVYYEGSEVQRAMSLDGYDYALNEKMQNVLRRLGMYFEEYNAAWGSVYR